MSQNPCRVVADGAGAEKVNGVEQSQDTSATPAFQPGASVADWPGTRSIRDSALQYAAVGWKVFRLSRSKKPLKGSHGFKDATSDPAIVEAWFQETPWANLGLATGEIVVIDVDGPGGAAELRRLADLHGGMRRTLASKTARGFHFFYRLPTGVRLRSINAPRSKSGADGIDVKADGGFVVLPPSVIAATGFVYHWANRESIAELPHWLVKYAESLRGKSVATENDFASLGPLPPYLKHQAAPDISRRAEGALTMSWSAHEEARLRSALKFIPADGYDMWIRVGMALHRLEWDRSDGTSISFEMWSDWSSKCEEKYSAAACEMKWASFNRTSYNGPSITVATVFHLASENGWNELPSNDFPMVADNPANDERATESARETSQKATDRPNSMISAADLRRMTFQPVRYVLPRFIPEGLTLLVGRPKVGKSWWALDLCLACAGNRPALGSLRPEHGDVLYLALEDSKRRLQNRIDKLMSPFTEEWPKRLNLVSAGGWPRADEGGLQKIENWCKSVEKPVLIVIDTLERIRKPLNGKSQLYSADYEAITGLQEIALDYGLAIVVLHHDRKSEADDAFDTVSGTLGLTGAADTILIIKRRPNGVVLFARGRDIEESETAMQFDKASCRWAILGAASEVHRSNERARVILALKTAGQPLTTREIMDEAEMRNRNAADILLGKMVKDGEILRVGRGRYSLSSENTGQNGQKERWGTEAADSIDKTVNLSDLSDLSGNPR